MENPRGQIHQSIEMGPVKRIDLRKLRLAMESTEKQYVLPSQRVSRPNWFSKKLCVVFVASPCKQ